MYFILFTALIFTVLWLLQTVFLQSFYNAMIVSNTRQTADEIIRNGSKSDIDSTIDLLARNNSLLVFITDTDNNVLYSSDAFKEVKGHGRNNNNIDEKKSGRHSYRSLPENYDYFMQALKSSDSDTAEYFDDSFYIYGGYFDYYYSGEKAVLYVGATIDPVGSSVTIISIQLMWVTVLSLIAGLALSWLIAKRFASPVKRLSVKAKKLGEDDYDPDFRKGFCSELDQLNDTLDKTNDKLIESRNFQMELLADVSHDLRTPLTMIKGYAEMVRDISREDEQQCAEDIAVIIKEADRLTALVNEIMEYSELKTCSKEALIPHTSGGHGETAVLGASGTRRIDLSAAVRMTADNFNSLYKHQGYIIEQKVQDGIFTNGIEGRLERALYNLMDNAVRHTGESKRVSITLRTAENKALIEVQDFGAGIPESEIEHIWDRYYTSRMRHGKGVSGLGLAIVKQTVEMHSGRCYVKSEAGKGSTFSIELPLC